MEPGIIELILTKTFEILGIRVSYKSEKYIRRFVKAVSKALNADKTLLYLNLLDGTERGIIGCINGNPAMIELLLETGDTDRGGNWLATMRLKFRGIKFVVRYRENTQELKRQALSG